MGACLGNRENRKQNPELSKWKACPKIMISMIKFDELAAKMNEKGYN